MRDNDESTRRILYVGCVLILALLAVCLSCPNAALATLCFLILA